MVGVDKTVARRLELDVERVVMASHSLQAPFFVVSALMLAYIDRLAVSKKIDGAS